jgi:hypothetical protein
MCGREEGVRVRWGDRLRIASSARSNQAWRARESGIQGRTPTHDPSEEPACLSRSCPRSFSSWSGCCACWRKRGGPRARPRSRSCASSSTSASSSSPARSRRTAPRCSTSGSAARRCSHSCVGRGGAPGSSEARRTSLTSACARATASAISVSARRPACATACAWSTGGTRRSPGSSTATSRGSSTKRSSADDWSRARCWRAGPSRSSRVASSAWRPRRAASSATRRTPSAGWSARARDSRAARARPCVLTASGARGAAAWEPTRAAHSTAPTSGYPTSRGCSTRPSSS